MEKRNEDKIINTEAEIKKYIREKKKSGVYFIYGKESYLNDFYADKLVKSVVDPSLLSFNYYKFNGDEMTFDMLYDACETLPIMSEKKCILIKDFPFLKTKKDDMEQYKKYLPTVPDTAVVIFLMSAIEVDLKDNKTKLKWESVIDYFENNENGTVFFLPRRKADDMVKMIVSGAQKRGFSISQETAKYFLQVVESDLNTIQRELDKLCAYSYGKEITKEAVDAVAVKSVEATVFDIIDAILSGETDRAFAILSKVLSINKNNKEVHPLVLGAMATIFVDMYRVKVAKAAHKNRADYLAVFASYKDMTFRLNNAAQMERMLSDECLKECIEAFVDADIKIKTFSMDNDLILEELLSKLIDIIGVRR